MISIIIQRQLSPREVANVIYSRFGESLILHLNLTENVLKNKFLTIVYSVVCEYLPSCSSPASLQNAAEP